MKYRIFSAIGWLFVFAVNANASLVPVKIDNRFTTSQTNKISQWLNFAIDASKTVHGELPMDRFSLTVKPSRWQRGTVPWGEVEREGTPQVNLIVNGNANIDALKTDWTVYHELSHLLIPYDGYGPRWLSEGLASYYQNVVQHRALLFDEQTMWQKLAAGFLRGKNETNQKSHTLAYVSDNLHENRNYMRVYWSGALFWLSMDIAERQRSQGRSSLDLLLKKLKHCCQHDELSGWQIIQKLDMLSGSKQFSRAFKTFAYSHEIPPYNLLLKSLGVVVESGKVVIDNDAPLASVRRGIETGSILDAKSHSN